MSGLSDVHIDRITLESLQCGTRARGATQKERTAQCLRCCADQYGLGLKAPVAPWGFRSHELCLAACQVAGNFEEPRASKPSTPLVEGTYASGSWVHEGAQLLSWPIEGSCARRQYKGPRSHPIG